MQTTIYLIRHGEVLNPDNILYGRLPNFGLSEKGKQEIEKSANFLKDKQIDELYASPLERAKESAEIIQKRLHIPTIHFSDEILEVRTSYQGRKFSELDALQSEVYLKPLKPSDETIEQIAQRMRFFLMELITKHKGKHITVVSHGDPIMALKAVIEHKPLEFYSFKTDNGHYIQHGEVYQITGDNLDTLTLTKAFTPQI